MDLTIADKNLSKMKSQGASKEEMRLYIDSVSPEKTTAPDVLFDTNEIKKAGKATMHGALLGIPPSIAFDEQDEIQKGIQVDSEATDYDFSQITIDDYDRIVGGQALERDISTITGKPVPTAEEEFAGARAVMNLIPYGFASIYRGMIPKAAEDFVMQPVTKALTGHDYVSPIDEALKASGKHLPENVQKLIGTPAQMTGIILPLSISFKTSSAILKELGVAEDFLIHGSPLLSKVAYNIFRGGIAGVIYEGMESGEPEEMIKTGAFFAALDGAFGAAAGTIKKIAKSTWYRKLTIKERGLVVQTAADMKNAGQSEGTILRKLSDKKTREIMVAEATAKRAKGEKPPMKEKTVAVEKVEKAEVKEPTKPLPPKLSKAKPPEVVREEIKGEVIPKPEPIEYFEPIPVEKIKSEDMETYEQVSIEASKHAYNILSAQEKTKFKEHAKELAEQGYAIEELKKPKIKKEIKKKIEEITAREFDFEKTISEMPEKFQEELLNKEIEIINQLLGKKPRARKDLKKVIREKAGIVKTDETIEVKEHEALRDQIRLEAQAAKKAFSAGKKEAALKHKERQRELLLKAKAQYEVRVKKIKTSKEILQRRRSFIRAAADHFNLTDAELRQISRKDIRLMSDYEFKQFIDMIRIKAEELDVKRQARNELELLRKEMLFKSEENIRKLQKLPPVSKMTTAQLNEYATILSGYKKGDQFLSPKRIKGLEDTVWNGAKTHREVLEKASELFDVPVSDLENIRVKELDRFRFDTPLARQNPFYQFMIDSLQTSEIKGLFRYFEAREELYRLGKLALKSRGRGITERLVPRQPEAMEYMETEDSAKEIVAKKLTKEEIDFVQYIQNFYAKAYNWLLVSQDLKSSRFADNNYVFHAKRPLSEMLVDIKDTGIKDAAKELLGRWRLDEAHFKILDNKTGEILSMRKFFRQTLYRTGELTPTKNIIKSTDIYMQQLFKKMALDESVVAIETLAIALRPKETTRTGIFLNDSLMTFVKEYLNNKKGRTISAFGIQQGGRIDGIIRFIDKFISLRYIALNIPLQTAAVVGETTAKYVGMGKIKLIKANIRKFTPQGRRILEKYKPFIGEGVLEELFQPGRNVGENINLLLYSVFKWLRKVTKQDLLLGNMTKAEFEAGEISAKRLAELERAMGRWVDVGGAKSIVGSTSVGAGITKFRGWAIPIASSVIHNAFSLARTLSRMGDPSKRLTKEQAWEVYRIAELGAFVTTVLSLGIDENRDTFLGNLKFYALRELSTVFNALSLRTMLTLGVTVAFLETLSNNISVLLSGKEQKYGEGLEGIRRLKRQLKPAAITQFEEKG